LRHIDNKRRGVSLYICSGEQQPSSMHIRCLDGLRACAIVLVICSHLLLTEIPLWFRSIFEYWDAGTVGVRLFFLISGFLIATLLNKELSETGRVNFVKFFMRRVLRIFPAYYFYLLVLTFLSIWGIISIDSSAIVFALFYIQNLNAFQNTTVFPSSWLVNHAWSLSVEEQFYILFPFLLKRIVSIVTNHLFKCLIVMTAVCSFFRVLNYSFPEISLVTGGVFLMHCDFLFYGVVLAILLNRHREQLKRKMFGLRNWLLLMATIILVFSSKVEYYSALHFLVSGNLILFSNLYILLFFLLFPNSTLGHLLETKPFRLIGKLSYSLYIWQQLFLGSTDLWLKQKSLTTYPANIVMIFICACCSFVFIEKPFLKLKNIYA